MEKKKIKVLHMLCSSRFSGAENVACQIIKMFKDNQDYEFAYASPDGQIKEALAERGIRFLPMRQCSFLEYRRVIKDFNPDIIHAHDMKATVLAAACCGTIPLISHVHNNNFDSRKLSLKTILYRLTCKKVVHAFWVSMSSYYGYYYHDKFKEKSSVLYNVINTDELREKAENAEKQNGFDIVYLGRLTPPKNPQRLIKILASVIQKNPGTQCAVIGSGELAEITEECIRSAGAQNNIHMLGFMDNAYGILKHSKLMLMTSRWEGTPMCALEAMALGVPLVSTPTDGLKELVVSGETGYLSNDDNELAENCIRIINYPEERRKFSSNTLARSDKMMDIDHYYHEILKSYELCTKNRCRAGSFYPG